MKIGLSLSRCVQDIIDGIVDVDEVLVIIARTHFTATKPEDLDFIYHGYIEGGQWKKDYELKSKYLDTVLDLWFKGKIHQPRVYGSYRALRSEYWLEAVLPSSELEKNSAAKAAWEQFKFLAELTNVKLDHSVE